MPDNSPDLCLHEQVLLLALRDADGTIEAEAGQYPHALGGAILAELILRNRLRVASDKEQLVELIDESVTKEPILDEALSMVLNEKNPRSSADWVERFTGISDLKHKVAHELCDRGILEDSLEKVLLIFSRKVYPEVNHEPEQELIDTLRAAVFSEKSEVEPRVAILVSLSHAAGILNVYFDKGDLERRADRIKEIVNGSALKGAAGHAVESAIMAQQAAVITATTTAVIAATAS